MKQQLFTVAGTSIRQGETKVRFANDLVSRVKALNRAGHKDVNLVELPKPMTKLEALQHLHSLGMSTGDVGYAVASKLVEKTKIAKKGEVKVSGTVVQAKTTKPAVEA